MIRYVIPYFILIIFMMGITLYLATTVVRPDANKRLSVLDRIVRGLGVLLLLFLLITTTGVWEALVR
jgi:hypothetical protein